MGPKECVAKLVNAGALKSPEVLDIGRMSGTKSHARSNRAALNQAEMVGPVACVRHAEVRQRLQDKAHLHVRVVTACFGLGCSIED